MSNARKDPRDIHCPACRETTPDTKGHVFVSRTKGGLGALTGYRGVTRERECKVCHHRWLTFEVNQKGMDIINRDSEM